MKTVFHVSSPVPGEQEHAMVNVLNLLGDAVHTDGDRVALVTNGGGVRMFVAATASAPERVERLRSAGVDLYACGNALRAMDVGDDDLLTGVETAPSGVGVLARLQNEGYGYIKAP